MRKLAEELYERTKDMISDIAIDVMEDHNASHDKDRLLTSILNEYYTLWNNPAFKAFLLVVVPYIICCR